MKCIYNWIKLIKHFFFRDTQAQEIKETFMGTPRLLLNFSFINSLTRDTRKTQFDLLISPSSKKEIIGVDRNSNPMWSVDCTYTTKKNLADAFNICKEYVDANVISASISSHLCSHHKGESQEQWTDCKNAEYAEFIKK